MAPSKEVFLSGRIEPEERELVEWTHLRAQCERVQLRKPAKYFPHAFADFGVRELVDVLPFVGNIRPHHQAKALDQTIASGTAGIGSADIFGDADGLRVAQYGDAHCFNVKVSAHDPVERVRLRA